MKQASLNCIFSIAMFACSGCVSTSISDSLALIEQENNIKSDRTVNKSVLTSIQALRISQTIAEQHHTFTYDLNSKELNYEDKIKITNLVMKNNLHVTIKISPAKGTNKLDQLAFSLARAELLRRYISHFKNKITIRFSPNLPVDTINLSTDA
ncbi:MAG: hypothetical protein OCD00_06380 [Colwellia sp.]